MWSWSWAKEDGGNEQTSNVQSVPCQNSLTLETLMEFSPFPQGAELQPLANFWHRDSQLRIPHRAPSARPTCAECKRFRSKDGVLKLGSLINGWVKSSGKQSTYKVPSKSPGCCRTSNSISLPSQGPQEWRHGRGRIAAIRPSFPTRSGGLRFGGARARGSGAFPMRTHAEWFVNPKMK